GRHRRRAAASLNPAALGRRRRLFAGDHRGGFRRRLRQRLAAAEARVTTHRRGTCGTLRTNDIRSLRTSSDSLYDKTSYWLGATLPRKEMAARNGGLSRILRLTSPEDHQEVFSWEYYNGYLVIWSRTAVLSPQH